MKFPVSVFSGNQNGKVGEFILKSYSLESVNDFKCLIFTSVV